ELVLALLNPRALKAKLRLTLELEAKLIGLDEPLDPLFLITQSMLSQHPSEWDTGGRIWRVIERCLVEVSVKLAGLSVRVFDHAGEGKRCHERGPLADARGELALV